MSKKQDALKWSPKIGAVLLFVTVAHASAEPASNNVPAEDPNPQPEPLPIEEGLATGMGAPDVGGVDEFEDSLDLMFEDFGVVVSASRSEQTLAQTSVPVSVITSEQIRLSGAREIPELLFRVPGMDILRMDNNRWSIGVRGLHQTFSDRTLFLVNGQNINSAFHGGVDFQRLPVFLEDIEQIEVVRGPGGGAWGANAFSGVVNVIEKSPMDTQGVLLSSRIDEHGTTDSVFRVGVKNDQGFAARLTGSWSAQDASDAAFNNNGGIVAQLRSDDFSRNRKFGIDTVFGHDSDTKVELSLGHAHLERADSAFVAIQTGDDERIEYTNWSAKLSKDLGSDRSLSLQYYGVYEDVLRPSFGRFTTIDNTIDAQYEFVPADDHEMTVGAVFRWIQADVEDDLPGGAFTTGVFNEQWGGAFVSDRWNIDDRWSLESQARVDWYSETQTDWAGRVALIHDLSGDKRHILRLSGAKAFRTPQFAIREISAQRVALPSPPAPPGSFVLTLLPSKDLKNEQVYSLEIGYTGKLTDHITLRADAYAQHFENLTGALELPEPAPIIGRNFYTLANIGDAEAYGIETELAYEVDGLSLSAWYAFNNLEPQFAGQDTRAFLPAKHKVGISATGELTGSLTAAANYRYTDTTPSNLSPKVDISHKIDLVLTYAVPDWHAEFQIGVQDLLDDTDVLVNDQSGDDIGQRSRGRSAFFRVRWEF